jgi:hypothetical protein
MFRLPVISYNTVTGIVVINCFNEMLTIFFFLAVPVQRENFYEAEFREIWSITIVGFFCHFDDNETIYRYVC